MMSHNVQILKDKFTETFTMFKWSSPTNESKSGEGSSLYYSDNYSKELTNLITKYDIKKILDCSCGDWNWMSKMENVFVDYTGIDIVNDVIIINNDKFSNDRVRFHCSDMLTFIKESSEIFDLIICRHTFEHLPEDYVLDVIKASKRIGKFLLFSSQTRLDTNTDIMFDGVGYRIINLGKEPYYELLGDKIDSFYDTEFKNGHPTETDVFAHLYLNKL